MNRDFWGVTVSIGAPGSRGASAPGVGISASAPSIGRGANAPGIGRGGAATEPNIEQPPQWAQHLITSVAQLTQRVVGFERAGVPLVGVAPIGEHRAEVVAPGGQGPDDEAWQKMVERFIKLKPEKFSDQGHIASDCKNPKREFQNQNQRQNQGQQRGQGGRHDQQQAPFQARGHMNALVQAEVGTVVPKKCSIIYTAPHPNGRVYAAVPYDGGANGAMVGGEQGLAHEARS
ncbi:hypothetical protein IFM89_036349 [Coptis chinensis]|uniref:Uncharacterized protein n=1 Tax=Coptis chinensis TaxID=261450 RepID=A0A835HJF1_9MAGN|nr:hypothetical protein IFM89_036349 [Coptis chinensis]